MLKLKFLAVAGLALLWSGCGHKVYKPSNDIQINQEQLKNLQAQNPKADVFDFRRLTPSDPTGGGGEPQGIIICLLYTSPSPRDLSTSRMPSSA